MNTKKTINPSEILVDQYLSNIQAQEHKNKKYLHQYFEKHKNNENVKGAMHREVLRISNDFHLNYYVFTATPSLQEHDLDTKKMNRMLEKCKMATSRAVHELVSYYERLLS